MNEKKIISAIKVRYPSVVVEVEPYDVYGVEFAVRCYGVERHNFDDMTDFIIDLNDEYYPEGSIELISFLFTEEEARAHFSRIGLLLPQACRCGNSDASSFFDEEFSEIAEPQPVVVCEWLDLDSGVGFCDPSMSVSGESWEQPAEVPLVDDEYARAA